VKVSGSSMWGSPLSRDNFIRRVKWDNLIELPPPTSMSPGEGVN